MSISREKIVDYREINCVLSNVYTWYEPTHLENTKWHGCQTNNVEYSSS